MIIAGLRHRYNQLLEIQKSSVRKQLALLTENLPSKYKSLVVHTLKANANPSNLNDR